MSGGLFYVAYLFYITYIACVCAYLNNMANEFVDQRRNAVHHIDIDHDQMKLIEATTNY